MADFASFCCQTLSSGSKVLWQKWVPDGRSPSLTKISIDKSSTMVDDNNSIMDLRRRQQLMRQSFFAARIVILSVVMAATSVQTTRLPRYLPQRPEHRNDPRIARGIIYHHLGGPERQFYDLFRMSKEVFVALRDWMFSNTHLRDTRYQTVEQKLLIFIWILAYNEPQRNTAARDSESPKVVYVRSLLIWSRVL